jgi:hypothetical protein
VCVWGVVPDWPVQAEADMVLCAKIVLLFRLLPFAIDDWSRPVMMHYAEKDDRRAHDASKEEEGGEEGEREDAG